MGSCRRDHIEARRGAPAGPSLTVRFMMADNCSRFPAIQSQGRLQSTAVPMVDNPPYPWTLRLRQRLCWTVGDLHFFGQTRAIIAMARRLRMQRRAASRQESSNLRNFGLT